MRANSPSAYLASVTLHATVVAIVLLIAFLVGRHTPPPPMVFELVAGAPTAPFEKEAPALGRPDVKLDVPKTKPVPQPEPEEDVAEQAPPVKVVAPPKQETPKPKETPKAREAPKKITPPKEKPKQMSYEEFTKKHGKPQPAKAQTPPRASAKVPRIDTKGIVVGVKGGSTANNRGGGGGKAMSRDDAADMLVYQTALKNRLKIAHDELKPTGLGDSVSAEVEFFVAANGEIGNVRIVRSSGNAEFDASVLASFRKITWLGARPDNRSDTWRLTFRMRELD